MGLPALLDPVPLSTDARGVIRVGSTRVTLETIAAAFEQGASPEEICERYSTLDRADVYRTIAYILDHRGEVERYVRERETAAELTRKELESRFGEQTGLRAQLLARRGA